MHILADSSSTRTEWVAVDGTSVIDHAVTSGINPYFMTRREISHAIRLELPDSFFHHRWQKVCFYGSGCTDESKSKIVEASLIAQFKSPVMVTTNLLGAARRLLLHSPGLVGILSTGANSCYYGGSDIARHVRSGGYILGDEGSNADLGKRLLSDVLKGIAPAEIIEAFYHHFSSTPDQVMDCVYAHSQPNQALASYAGFLAENTSHPYCRQLVYDAFMAYFRRNIGQYDYRQHPVAFLGATAMTYSAILHQAAADFGASISRIESSAIPGLIQYHGAD